jgi:hypothetical protein
MSKMAAILHSPFSLQMMEEEHHRSLLLQLLLHESLKTYEMYRAKTLAPLHPTDSSFFPFDWSLQINGLHKIREHGSLLKAAYPLLNEQFLLFQTHLDALLHCTPEKECTSTFVPLLQQLFCSLEPFCAHCKKNENLIYFLLTHQERINGLMGKTHLRALLHSFFPEGLQNLYETMSDRYYQRGFQTLIPQLQSLIAKIDAN